MTKALFSSLLLAMSLTGNFAHASPLHVHKADPYTDSWKLRKFDPYTDGTKVGRFDVFTDGTAAGKFDIYDGNAKSQGLIQRDAP